MRKRKKKSWEVIQRHHLEYAPVELTVKITRTEHFFCGRMESYAKAHGFTYGMCRALRYMAKKYRRRASAEKKGADTPANPG